MTPAERRVILAWLDYCAAPGPVTHTLVLGAFFVLQMDRSL